MIILSFIILLVYKNYIDVSWKFPFRNFPKKKKIQSV